MRQAEKGGNRPRRVESAVGHWTGRFLTNRGALSIFNHVYRWNESARKGRKQPMWPGVRGELRTTVAIAPLLFPEQDLPVMTEAGCMDASGEGFAATVMEAPPEDVRHELRWAEQKGWFVRLCVKNEEVEEEDSFQASEVWGRSLYR